MKKIFNSLLTLWFFSAFACGCTKTGGSSGEDDLHQVDQNDDIFPVITIARPLANQVYVSGDSIIVEGNATDNKVMYKGKVLLINDMSGLIAAEQYFETHFLTILNFRIAYKVIITTQTDFTVKTEFEDHGLNKTIQTIKVKVNP